MCDVALPFMKMYKTKKKKSAERTFQEEKEIWMTKEKQIKKTKTKVKPP